MYRKALEEADMVLGSVFFNAILSAVTEEQQSVVKRIVNTTIADSRDTHKIARYQGKIDGLSRILKLPDRVYEQLKQNAR